jgi:hypothetical protein
VISNSKAKIKLVLDDEDVILFLDLENEEVQSGDVIIILYLYSCIKSPLFYE